MVRTLPDDRPDYRRAGRRVRSRVAIGKCDVDDNKAVATQFSVRNIPTILFIKGGQVVDKQVGACPKSVLEEKITKLL